MNSGTSRIFGIILFTVIGVSALVLGVLNAKNGIKSPLQIDATTTAQAGVAYENDQALKQKDTDSDKLSDYDELYTYHTSPYIMDTDSDNIPDGEEVKNGTDPICPEGRDCAVPDPVNYPKPVEAGGANTPNLDLPNLDILNTTNANSDVAAAAAKIRELLRSGNPSQETLDALNAISDQELVDMYNESATEINKVNNNAAQNNE